MKSIFAYRIGGLDYHFKRVFIGDELRYNISFYEEGKAKTFHMKEENGKWKKQPKVVPSGYEVVLKNGIESELEKAIKKNYKL